MCIALKNVLKSSAFILYHSYMAGDRSHLHKITFIRTSALGGVSQWIEHEPVKQRVAGSIPSQGPGLGCGQSPQ